jgi:hypothetical protein
MKTITLAIEDDLYRRAERKAAEKKSSLSALLQGALASLVGKEESDFERLKREEDELRTKLFTAGGGLSASENLSREELHDRHALR